MPAALGSCFERAPSSTSAACRRLSEFRRPVPLKETEPCHIVHDANGQTLASSASSTARDEARRIAANIAKLPVLLRKG